MENMTLEIPFEYACEGIFRVAFNCERGDKLGSDAEEFRSISSYYKESDEDTDMSIFDETSTQCSLYIKDAIRELKKKSNNEIYLRKLDTAHQLLNVPNYLSFKNAIKLTVEALNDMCIELPEDILLSFSEN